MTSPVGNRRRQRSTRLVVAALMIVVSAAVVVATALTGSWLLVTVAGLVAVLLGATATKITHSELIDSREEAARDRAQQARAYADLTEVRTAENVEFAADMTGKVAKRDATISRLEKRLGDAAAELADARRELSEARDEAAEAQQEAERLGARLADAEERAHHAVVRMAELEAELDVVTSELQAERAAARAWQKGKTA
jgi:chromosome segregation ATPase